MKNKMIEKSLNREIEKVDIFLALEKEVSALEMRRTTADNQIYRSYSKQKGHGLVS